MDSDEALSKPEDLAAACIVPVVFIMFIWLSIILLPASREGMVDKQCLSLDRPTSVTSELFERNEKIKERKGQGY